MKEKYDIIIKYEMIFILFKVFVCSPLAVITIGIGREAESILTSIILLIISLACIGVCLVNLGILIQQSGKFIKINQNEFVYCYYTSRRYADCSGNDCFLWSEIKSIEYCEKTFSKGILITNLQGISRYIRVSAVEYDAEEIVMILLDYQKKVVNKSK